MEENTSSLHILERALRDGSHTSGTQSTIKTCSSVIILSASLGLMPSLHPISFPLCPLWTVLWKNRAIHGESFENISHSPTNHPLTIVQQLLYPCPFNAIKAETVPIMLFYVCPNLLSQIFSKSRIIIVLSLLHLQSILFDSI